MATKKINKTAKKIANNNNVTFKKSYKSIKSTAKNVNNQMVETAEDVVEDIMENGTQIKDEAVKTVKEAINKITKVVTVENIKESVDTANKYSLKTANELVDGAMVNSEQWQKVAAKAVKGGLKLAAKQQDIMFDTLEDVKVQFIHGTKRFRKIFK